MQRIQKSIVLIAVASLFGCSTEDESKSVSYYIHDIDLAHATVAEAKKDLAKYGNKPTTLNASAALAMLSSPSMIECWPGPGATTANTDHDCLNRKGYKR